MSLELLGGYTILQCASGQEALEKAESFAPQVLLLDVMMPGMSGEETLAALRELPAIRDCLAIFVTAKAQSSEVKTLVERNGAAGVIVKPFDPTALAGEVAAIMEGIGG